MKPRLQECKDIEGALACHDERFYALLGGEIKMNPADRDESDGSQSSYFFSC